MKWLDGWKKILRRSPPTPHPGPAQHIRKTEEAIMEHNRPPMLYPHTPHWSIRSQGCYLHILPTPGADIYARHWDPTKRTRFYEHEFVKEIAESYLEANPAIPFVRIYSILSHDGKEGKYKEIENPNYQPNAPKVEVKPQTTFTIRLSNNQDSYIFFDDAKHTTMYDGVPPMGGRYSTFGDAMSFADKYVRHIAGSAVEVVELKGKLIQRIAGKCKSVGGNYFGESKDPEPKTKPQTTFLMRLVGDKDTYIFYDGNKTRCSSRAAHLVDRHHSFCLAMATAEEYVSRMAKSVELVELDGDKVIDVRGICDPSFRWKDLSHVNPPDKSIAYRGSAPVELEQSKPEEKSKTTFVLRFTPENTDAYYVNVNGCVLLSMPKITARWEFQQTAINCIQKYIKPQKLLGIKRIEVLKLCGEEVIGISYVCDPRVPPLQPEQPQPETDPKATFLIKFTPDKIGCASYMDRDNCVTLQIPKIKVRYSNREYVIKQAQHLVKSGSYPHIKCIEVLEFRNDFQLVERPYIADPRVPPLQPEPKPEQSQPKKNRTTCFAMKLSGPDGSYIFHDGGNVVFRTTLPPMYGQYWTLKGAISAAHEYVGEYKIPVEVVEIDDDDKVVGTPWRSDAGHTDVPATKTFDSEQHTTKTCYAILRKDTGHYLNGISPQIEWKKGLENAQLYMNKPTAVTQAQYANKEVEIIPVEYESIERRTIATS